MDDALQAQIEPELLGPTPRRIRRRGTRGFGTVFSRFLMVSLLALTLFILLWGMHLTAVRLYGPIVPGSVVERYTRRDDDGKELRYLAYRYSVNGQQYDDRDLVNADVYAAVPVGAATTVQVSPWWPGTNSLLLVPGNDPWEDARMLGVGSLIMLAGTAAMVWYLIILPKRRLRLVAVGEPIVGRLIDKSRSYRGGQPIAHFFHYEFEPPLPSPARRSAGQEDGAPAPPLKGKQNVRSDEWNSPQIGEAFTILYDPKHPKTSLMYKYADFEAISQD